MSIDLFKPFSPSCPIVTWVSIIRPGLAILIVLAETSSGNHCSILFKYAGSLQAERSNTIYNMVQSAKILLLFLNLVLFSVGFRFQ